jgi:2,5-dioxopentanoate dehydrogenase
MMTGAHWIAGLNSQQGETHFFSVNPRTRDRGTIAYADATIGEIDAACQAAAQAFQETRLYPAARLAGFLDAVANALEQKRDVLVSVADRETALGETRLNGELGRTTGQLRAFAGLLNEGSYVEAIIDSAQPDRKPAPRPDIRRMLHPLGPVAVFAASNFPFAFSVCGGDTASAWAAGCPVVVKAHPGHPDTSALFAEIVTETVRAVGFPPGFFSLLHGAGHQVGSRLVRHDAIAAVGFTGSQAGGNALFSEACRRPNPIPVYAEMGSINPILITRRALELRLDALAEGLAGSVLLGAGQFCTNPGLIVLEDNSESRRFVHEMGKKLSERAPQVLLNEQVLTGLSKAVDQTLRAGVEIVAGGAAAQADGFCFQNTLLQTSGAALLANPDLEREHFGPVTMAVLCTDMDEMLAVVQSLEGQLTLTLHAEADEADEHHALLTLMREKAGRVIWNGYPTGVEVVYAQQHGGPYPATTAPATTSVGLTAIYRFLRPVAYQNLPDVLLPDALRQANPLGIWRIVDGQRTQAPG